MGPRTRKNTPVFKRIKGLIHVNLHVVLTIVAYLGVFVVAGLALRNTLAERPARPQTNRDLA